MGNSTRATGTTQHGWLGRLWRRLTGAYPGDFVGIPTMEYSPVPDGRPDPGEIVWTWVPFEDDHRAGKDRPVLLVGRDGRWLLGVMLTTKLRADATRGRRPAPSRVSIGVGPWDRQRRPSEVRVDRIIRVRPSQIRREGAAIDAARFALVTDAIRRRR